MKSIWKMVLVPYIEGVENPQNKGLQKDLILLAMLKSLKRKAVYRQGSQLERKRRSGA